MRFISKKLAFSAITVGLLLTFATGLLPIQENEEVSSTLPYAIILGRFGAATRSSTFVCGSALFPYETISRGLPAPYLQSYGQLSENNCSYTGTKYGSVVSFVVDWLVFSVSMLILMIIVRFFHRLLNPSKTRQKSTARSRQQTNTKKNL